MDAEAQPLVLDTAALTPPVRRALESDTVTIVDWSARKLGYAAVMPTSGGVYRVAGAGLREGTTVPWSMILKVIQSPEGCVSLGGTRLASDFGTDPATPFYWKREALACQSGLLEQLPGGLTAPRCYGVVEWPGDVIWLWLEEIAGIPGAAWPLTRYRLAARHLGQFNGTYLTNRTMPTHPWLSVGRLRARDAQLTALRDVDRFNRRDSWEHPLLRRAFPPPIVDRMLRLFQDRGLLLDALDRLPQTLCHLDALSSNLMARLHANGQEQTVALDWASVGKGAIGEEICQLVVNSLTVFDVAPANAKELDELAFQGYLEGLRDVGWRGDERQVRLGYAASAAVRWGWMAPEITLSLALDEQRRADVERRWGRPVEEIIEWRAAVTSFLLERADEARDLMATTS